MYINLTLISQKNINQVQMNNRVELNVVKAALQLNWNSTHTHARTHTRTHTLSSVYKDVDLLCLCIINLTRVVSEDSTSTVECIRIPVD